MDDLISRQDAIEEFAKRDTTDGTIKVFSGREIREVLKELPSKQKWIPCSERLPEEIVPVNVTWVSRAAESYEWLRDKPFTATAIYSEGQWYWFSSVIVDLLPCGSWELDKVHEKVEILAWMPLPEPYKMCVESEEMPMTKEEALDILQNTAWYGTNEDRERTEQAVEMVSRLLLRKKGKWIYHHDWDLDGECPYECNQCGMGSDVDYDFCMRCGAEMWGEENETN